jgi:hypothetical protein
MHLFARTLPVRMKGLMASSLLFSSRRGYRVKMHKSALNEAAAAGVLTLAGWDQLCLQGPRGGWLAGCMCVSVFVCACMCVRIVYARSAIVCTWTRVGGVACAYKMKLIVSMHCMPCT